MKVSLGSVGFEEPFFHEIDDHEEQCPIRESLLKNRSRRISKCCVSKTARHQLLKL